jgi:hypothetical protein
MNVEEEVGRLKEEIQRLGKVQPDGSYKVNLRVQLQTHHYFFFLEFKHMISLKMQ